MNPIQRFVEAWYLVGETRKNGLTYKEMLQAIKMAVIIKEAENLNNKISILDGLLDKLTK